MTMDFMVPLNRLIYGQEDGAGINARITGRDDGIPELAANIHARGQIENLVVKRAGDDPGTPLPPDWEGTRDLYSVSNGNRRLKALRMIYSETSTQPVKCTLRDVDEAGAFEDSLTTAVTAKQLHPVDQHEAFARLRDRHGKTSEEIAQQYGMSEREVEQALALGHLAPVIRDAWRKGEIKTSVAKAFTLAPDHKSQEELLDRLGGEQARDGQTLLDLDDYDIKDALKIGDDNSGALIEFVGIEAYCARGGKVTRDLFGTDHQVSDPKLAKAMAAERLKSECKKLTDAGWSFAVTEDSVRNTQHDYSNLKVDDAKPTDAEADRLAELNAVFNTGNARRAGYYTGDSLYALTAAEQRAYLAYHELADEIERRRYPEKLMAKAGCFVGIDENGLLEITYGKVKPAQKKAAEQEVKAVKRETARADATAAVAAGKPPPESTKLSNALKQRLEAQLIAATRDAIAAEPQLANSPLFEGLARTICSMIIPDRPFHMPDAVRTKLPTLRQALNAGVFNAALAKRFDAENYFSSAPKGFVLKAIAEAINPDEARKVSAKTKAEIWKFALANLGKTGWLPKELRSVHYAGPGSEGYKKHAAPAIAAPGPAVPKVSPAMRTALHKAEKALQPLKRAAAVKKAATKTSAKKKPAGKKKR
jgi:ParB family chromosome partitioning protein